jgi:hypothetical protein
MAHARKFIFCLLLSLVVSARAAGTNSIAWHRAADRVDANVQGETLVPLLGQIATDTGWQVYVEPGTVKTVSAKFKDLPSHEALQMLLGDLNFMVSPQTNGTSELYVFSTVIQNATQLVPAAKVLARHVTNQLLVKLKPGTSIDALAKLLGAKVIGRNDKMGIYQLQFADAAATEAALGQLQTDSDVQAVDYNYVYDPPPAAQPLAASSAPPISLQLKPPSDSGKIIVGLVDTAVQPLDASLNDFLLKQLSVADGTQADGDSLTHGTAMAETILRSLEAAEQGSSSVQILPVDVYGSSTTTTSWDVANGLADAVNNGANVINMSLGGSGDSTFLDSVVQSVEQEGIPIYAAAGNDAVSTPEYPAAFLGVISVTAEQQGELASYANFGPWVEMAAPGSSVAFLGGQAWEVEGTSVSTAYMTGLAAGTADTTHQTWAAIQTALAKAYPVPTK